MISLNALQSEVRMRINGCGPLNNIDGLIDMMRFVGKLDTIIEVGSHRGVSTEVLLHFCNKLIAVDIWPDDRAKREFDARFSTEKNVSYIRMPSVEASKLFNDSVADMVYIDADHKEQSVIDDITAWKPKAKTWLAGHDYCQAIDNGGVIKAVKRTLEKPHKVFLDTSWLVRLQ